MNAHQFVAPKGLGSLRAGTTYHRLHTDSTRERVLFVSFATHPPAARMHIVEQRVIETGLRAGKLVPVAKPSQVPPWLEEIGSLEVLSHRIEAGVGINDEAESAAGQASIVEARLRHIKDAITSLPQILAADDPCAELNACARSCSPRQNETRFRHWVLSYLAFGRQQAVLAPLYHRRGKYNRLKARTKASSFGRRDNSGNHCPCKVSSPMVQAIQDAFRKRAKVGRTRNEVYGLAMKRDFGCTAKGNAKTGFWFEHPGGKAFPTQDQFWYRCEKHIGRAGIKKVLRGEETYRNKEATSLGPYSSMLTNVCERVHADAEYLAAPPVSYVSREPLPSMAMVQMIDGLSGMCLGVGFELGSETGQSYLEALFCMAVPKSLFGKLIGYPIDDEDWPGHGIPTSLLVDRGPGASMRVLGKLKEQGIWRQMTPSYSPQSNSTVESRHARMPRMSGAPMNAVSGLTPIQMVQRQVEGTLNLNASSSGLSRASNDQLIRGALCPMHVHADMLSRLRSDAQHISVEDAVKTFLKPVEFTVREGQLTLFGRPYGGGEFQGTTLASKLKKLDGTKWKGYAMNIATRYTWVEVGGKPVMVEALLPFRDDAGQLFLSLQELEQLGGRVTKLGTQQRKQRAAASAVSNSRFEKQTGLSAAPTNLRRGPKPPVSPGAKREASILQGK